MDLHVGHPERGSETSCTKTGSMDFPVLCARLRMPLVWTAGALIVGSAFVDVVPFWLALAVFIVGMAVYLRVGTVRREPLEVHLPVRGCWVALNSPASRVPSHGLHAYGQTYAIDLAHEPEDRPRPRFAWWPLARRPTDFPAFGQPIHAVADGVVVRVHDRERDHWSRNSWLSMPYFVIESSLRELLGPGRIVGNHVVLKLGDGTYAVFAHLRRGSVRVKKGQQLRAGDELAACGNSGNSTEPHLHFHLMDRPSTLFAAGLPFRFDHYEIDRHTTSGVPANGQRFLARSPVTK
jgi:hypothetical protein